MVRTHNEERKKLSSKISSEIETPAKKTSGQIQKNVGEEDLNLVSGTRESLRWKIILENSYVNK